MTEWGGDPVCSMGGGRGASGTGIPRQGEADSALLSLDSYKYVG